MPAATDPPVHFINVEYFFRLIYETVFRAHGGSLVLDLASLAARVWIAVSVIAFILSAGAIFLLVHSTLRLYKTLAEDEKNYATFGDAHAAEVVRDHSRWAHVMNLIESGQESDWRQAIIEADIMLDDLLTQLGYAGASVGEKLRAIDPKHFATLNDAWEAHKIRNEIAHQGSQFPLSNQLAYRTIAHYENVMREHGEI